MCDYSLHAVSNRLANEGESLRVHKFHTGSKGLASPADIEAARPRGWKRLLAFLLIEDPRAIERYIPAVCVPPGARLRLIVPTGSKDATFTQITSEPYRYRDAVRFEDGEVVLLQRFQEGMRVEVLSLSVEEEPEAVGQAEELIAVPTNPGEWRMISNA